MEHRKSPTTGIASGWTGIASGKVNSAAPGEGVTGAGGAGEDSRDCELAGGIHSGHDSQIALFGCDLPEEETQRGSEREKKG